jgi:uncharacterized protein (TIGR02646 family)
MKHIKKDKEPKSLSEWNQKPGKRTSNWKSFDRSVKNDVFFSLLKEQGYICCYCGISITRNNCHIEHYKPKSIYPDLTYQYINLITSCQGEDEQRPTKPVHCGHKKNNWYDEDLMVSPLDPNCDKYFKYSGYGEIIPAGNPDQELAAKTTINRLALSIDKLRKMRQSAISGVLEATEGLSDEEIQLLAKGYQQVDINGRHTPFSAAITYTLEQYF